MGVLPVYPKITQLNVDSINNRTEIDEILDYFMYK